MYSNTLRELYLDQLIYRSRLKKWTNYNRNRLGLIRINILYTDVRQKPKLYNILNAIN
jgi:hypothetical protein